MKSLVRLCRAFLAASLLLLLGCPLPTVPGPGGSGGSLTIQVGNHINSQTLLPPISLTATSYTVSGTGPGGATFSQTTSGGAVTVDHLAFGSWTITVDAMNAEGTRIGSGNAAASVHTGQTTMVAISVVPLTGNGTLNLTVNWTASQVESASIVARLTPPVGDVTPLSFSIDGNEARYSSTTMPAGYQTLTVQLMDSGIAVMGAVEVVRIVAGQTTSGTYAFTNVNQPGGLVQVNISPALADPIPVSISGVPATVSAGTSITATASVSDGTTGVVYVWYLNGVSVGTGESFTFGSALAAGYYRLDVTAYTATRAGSATANLQVMSGQLPPGNRIAGGLEFSLFVDKNANLWATGSNLFGQLGDGTDQQRSAPELIMSGVSSVAAGAYHSVILKTDGTVWAMGSNSGGQLGDGTTTDRFTPVQIASGARFIEAGLGDIYFIKADNSLWTTGGGPLPPHLVMSDVRSVSASGYNTLIVKTDNSLWATGYNRYGMFGYPLETTWSSPVQVMQDVVSAEAGLILALVLKTDGTVWATGANGDGSLGDGTRIDRQVPVQVMSNVRSISAGNQYYLAVKNDSTLWANGYNGNGQLGDGTMEARITPEQVRTGVQSAVAGYYYHSIILQEDGTLWTMGANYLGQLGDGTTENRPTPVRILSSVF